LGWGVVILFIAIQFLARPLNIMASSIGSNLTWPERHLLAWIAPRGIVAAAISALFAVQLENSGYTDASVLVPLTFFVIIATVLLQSLTARPIAMWLKVAEPEPNGFIIIGANTVGRAIGKALSDQGVKVLLADAGWDHVTKARLEGLPCYYGSPVSAHAEKHISLIGMKGILAVSALDHVNLASALHFKAEIGSGHIYILRSHKENRSGDIGRFSLNNHGYHLFSKDITFTDLSSTLSRGGEIVVTKLTAKFGFKDFLDTHGKSAQCLFALDPQGNSHVFSEKEPVKASNGWKLIYLQKKARPHHAFSGPSPLKRVKGMSSS
ncbi:MAG TPA: sodium:proton antiporter, partial [Desulfobacteraceae bacterium]|nr:sodium:proton antiporter [Desulfobacteraceae bacterium]